MTRVKHFLCRRDTLTVVGLLYFAVAALVGGPWFALFTGGLVVLTIGGAWWLNRQRRVRRVGVGAVGLGVVMTVSGLAIGNAPAIVVPDALSYGATDARPVSAQAALFAPSHEDEIPPSPSASPTPSPSTKRITSRTNDRTPSARPSVKPIDSKRPSSTPKASTSPSAKPKASSSPTPKLSAGPYSPRPSR